MACRLIVREEGRERVLDLGAETVLVGRGADCRIVLNDAKCSRRHCEIFPWEGGYKLVDLESRNGTRVNEVLVNQRILAHGDQIKIGDAVLVFEDPLRDPGRRIPGRLKDYQEGQPPAAPIAPASAPIQPGPIDIAPPPSQPEPLRPSISRTTERLRRDLHHRQTEGLPPPSSRALVDERRREQEERRILKNVVIVVAVFLAVIVVVLVGQTLTRRSPLRKLADDYLAGAQEKFRRAQAESDPRKAVSFAREALREVGEIPSAAGDAYARGQLLAAEIRELIEQQEALSHADEARHLEALTGHALKARGSREVEAALHEVARFRQLYPDALPESLKRLDEIESDLRARRGTAQQRDYEEAQERIQAALKRYEYTIALGEADRILETYQTDFSLQQKAVELREGVMEAVRVFVEERRTRAQQYRSRGDREMALRVYDEILGALGQGRVPAFRGYVELILQERGE